MAALNSADVGFEKQLWASADILRGNIDASEYKHVVLGLIFLKYISDKFEARYQELVEEGDGFEEDIDEYSRMGVFYVPPSARWGATTDNSAKIIRRILI
ncbi:MAG: type I restriction-modification system subunit M N-terminal domain-containing protein [Dethiobacteria bacterium]